MDKTGQHDLADLRSFQDWHLRYWLQSVPGVAEVAAFGGFQKQYQVELDPDRLVAYNLPITRIVDAIRSGNKEVGGRELERFGTTYLIRGHGYLKSLASGGANSLLRNPAQAATIARAAAKQVATVQGRIGGFQKFQVRTAVDALNNNKEGLSKVQSVINDVDYAGESAELNRQNVLLQSAMSLLALANQQSTQVLALLK